jgi:uncharacterized membrane protein SirB2
MEQGIQLNSVFFLFHLIGFGMIATLLFAGPILERKFQKAETLEAKLAIHRAMKSVGLLSPLAVLVLVTTGIGNMYFTGLGPFKAGWLTAKLIFFAIVIVNGAMTGGRALRRGKLLHRLARGENVPNALPEMQRYNKQQTTFYFTQIILVLVILALSVFKPQ